MLPKWHILIGFVFSYILAYFLNFSYLSGFIIFVSSWLVIDLDHYVLYFIKTRDINIIKFYTSSKYKRNKWRTFSKSEKAKYKLPIYIFHGVECWLILAILAYFLNFIYFILLGFLVHLIPDWIELICCKDPIYIKLSQIYTFIKNKNKQAF